MPKYNLMASDPMNEASLGQYERNLLRFSDIMEQIKVDKKGKQKLLEVRNGFEEELKKLARHYEEIEKLTLYVNTKIETVEQMELENLETHIILDHRLKSKEEARRGKTAHMETQTEVGSKEMRDKEKTRHIRDNE